MSNKILKNKVLFLSDLFEPKELGEIRGSCVVCGRSTGQGLKIDYSANFTKYNLLQAGDCICPHCYELTRNQTYRRSMWAVSKEGLVLFKKQEMKKHILTPPEPPFGMYLTRTWQKQGYFKLINKVNYSKKRYFTALDNDVILIELKKARKMFELAEKLRKEKVTKEELEYGKLYPSRYENINLLDAEELQKYAKQKLWRLIVYAID